MRRRLMLLLGAVVVMFGLSAQPSYACCCVPHDICDTIGISC